MYSCDQKGIWLCARHDLRVGKICVNHFKFFLGHLTFQFEKSSRPLQVKLYIGKLQNYIKEIQHHIIHYHSPSGCCSALRGPFVWHILYTLNEGMFDLEAAQVSQISSSAGDRP